MLDKIKNIIKYLIIRKRIVPIVIKDIQSNLLIGKQALVVGGSSGIGLAIAKKMIETGCDKVYIAGTSLNKLQKVSKDIGSDYLLIDLLNIEEAIDNLECFLQDKKIDILINSAGIHGVEKFGCVTFNEWNNVININLRGLYFISQCVSNHMIKNKISGHILNISSASALKPSWTPYEISKRAVNGVTLGMAQELIKHGIVVNGLAPGPTATPMLNFSDNKDMDLTWSGNPSGRIAAVEEIANLALFMVSSTGDYIVGDTFYITGGSGTINITE